MLFYVFLVLGTWKGVLGEDDICDKYSHEACPLPDDWSFPPATEADMDRMCPILLQALDCGDDYDEKCGNVDPINRKFQKEVRILIEEACQEDSLLHSRMVEHIDCFHETIEKDLQVCRDGFEDKEDAIVKRINSITDEEGFDEDGNRVDLYAPFGCLIHTYETACIATKASARCGYDTGDLVIELVRRSGLPERSCVLAREERVAEYITLLELELEEETALNQILAKE